MTPLLDAMGVAKSYGTVVALKNASLQVMPGEVHALLGANGAGKSTLVKILTGAVKASGGKVLIRGEPRQISSPAMALKAGLVPVYQEPSLIPDLSIADMLRLTRTPVEAFSHWVTELGLEPDLKSLARDLPLATLRVLDLARALAREPDVLILDEMTAALPSNLSDRVLEVVRRQGHTGRSVIFISHRFVEIAAVCQRATVLRDGETVGVLDITPGVEDRIVELMLGAKVERAATVAAQTERPTTETPRLRIRNLQVGTKLNSVSFDLFNGEVTGIVALEGQGQDELFGVLSGSLPPAAGTFELDGKPARFTSPADAIAHGLAYIPGDRSAALLRQRSVRENIALPLTARFSRWGPIAMARERQTVSAAIARLQIDTRAQGEVQRLSGGNQQKVTIARWIAAGSRTLLCFDPTRGIDVRTKAEIYKLMRDLAATGTSILFYTSELVEVQQVCDRAVVIFGGRVVDTIPAAECTEAALTRAAYGLTREKADA